MISAIYIMADQYLQWPLGVSSLPGREPGVWPLLRQMSRRLS